MPNVLRLASGRKFPPRRLSALGLPICLALVCTGPRAAVAQDRSVDDGKPPQKPPVIEGVDGPLERLKPKTPDTEAEVKRRDAMAWYLTGQIRERRRDFTGAYSAYTKAVELDPRAVPVYRSLVPLAFQLKRNDEALKFAMKAVELDPSDYMLARRLAAFMASQRKFSEAVRLLELAANAKGLDKQSAAFVTIHRDMGLIYQALGDEKKAADSYHVLFQARRKPKAFQLDEQARRRLESDPVSSYERIGQALLAADRFESAKKSFLAAREDGGGRPGDLNYNLATVYLKTKEYNEARKELDKYLDAKQSSKGRAAYELLAEVLKAQKKSDELVGRLEDAAKNDESNKPLQYFLADQYVEANRLEAAEKLYTKTMDGSDDPIGLLGLAGLYRRQKKEGKWLTAVEGVLKGAKDSEQLEATLARLADEFKAVSQNEQFADDVIAAGRTEAGGDGKLGFERAVALAQLAIERKNTEAVRLFFDHALKQRQEMASVIYGQHASYLLTADEFQGAAEVLQKAANDPALRQERPNFLFRLSQALELNGQTDNALEAVREAQKLLPGVGLLEYQEGWIYYHARRYDRAIAHFEKVIQDHADNDEIVRRCRFSLSNIYVLQGDLRKGEKILEDVYADEPDNISVNNDLGYLWADQGKNLKQAEKMIRKAVEAEPDNPAYLDSLGWVLYKLGRYEEALPHLKRAVKLPGGGDATIWDHLGDCQDKLDRREDAVASWKKALGKAEKDRFPDEKLLDSLRKKLARPPAVAKPPRAE